MSNSVRKQFSVALLKIGNTPFSLETFASIPAAETKNTEINGTIVHSKSIFKDVREERFILIDIVEGAPLPRPPVVYNRRTQADEVNPRSSDQIERDDQTFAVIDIHSGRIFLSDFRKKKIMERWFAEKLQKEVYIKDVIDREHFLNEIRSIDTIYLSATPTLVGQMGILSSELTSDFHNYGVGINHIAVEISFSGNSLPDRMKAKISQLFEQSDVHAIEKLQVSGRYDDKFERVFNAEGIVDKITIETIPCENGLLDKNSVFSTLLDKIR